MYRSKDQYNEAMQNYETYGTISWDEDKGIFLTRQQGIIDWKQWKLHNLAPFFNAVSCNEYLVYGQQR